MEPITFPSPGFAGLNKQREQSLLSPEWATEAQNAVVDGAGRIAARKGWVKLTSSAISGTPDIEVLHEYEKLDGSTILVATAANKIYTSSDNGVTFTDSTGSLTITANKWQFVNFNGEVVGVQSGHAPISWAGTSDFAIFTAGSGSLPSNPIAALSAFGRVWYVDADKQTIKYSGLLDHTLFDVADGGGTLDMTSVWTNGTDEVVALAAFGSSFIVFGRRHVIIYVDGQGSDIGIDPETMYVTDTIEGAGTIARDSVKNIGEADLMFLSRNGIRSLLRVLQDRQTPLQDITKDSRDYFKTLLLGSSIDQTKVRSIYSPEEGLYLLVSPDAHVTVCVDVKGQQGYRITEWPQFEPTAMVCRKLGDILFGFEGVVGSYSGYLDNTSTYRFVFRSGWIDLGEQNAVLKVLKRMKLIAYSPAGVQVIVKWFFDFQRDFGYGVIDYIGDGADEYGIGGYGTAEYSGGNSQRINYVPANKSGQYLLFGVETEINNRPFAVQSITAYYSPGRLA